MSRINNPYDNATAESFMETHKQEEVNGRDDRNVAAASVHRSLPRGGLQPATPAFRPRLSTLVAFKASFAALAPGSASGARPDRTNAMTANRSRVHPRENKEFLAVTRN
jgi:hypothetical protein